MYSTRGGAPFKSKWTSFLPLGQGGHVTLSMILSITEPSSCRCRCPLPVSFTHLYRCLEENVLNNSHYCMCKVRVSTNKQKQGKYTTTYLLTDCCVYCIADFLWIRTWSNQNDAFSQGSANRIWRCAAQPVGLDRIRQPGSVALPAAIRAVGGVCAGC